MTKLSWALGIVAVLILAPTGFQRFLEYRKPQSQQLERDRQLRQQRWRASHPDGEMKGNLWFSPDGQIYSQNELARVDEAGRRSTSMGIPFDEPITIKTGDALFRVPAGYLWYWPQPEHVGKVVTRNVDEDGLEIVFWFPSKRPFEIRRFPGPFGPQPREYLRPRPAPDEFPLVVNELRIVSADAYVSPSKGFDNVRRLFSGPGDKYEERFGLQWYRLENDHDPRDDYRHIPGTQPQAHLSCSEAASGLPNPGCTGRIHFDADDLAFFVRFRRPMLPRWREAVTIVRDLALAWRVKPKQ